MGLFTQKPQEPSAWAALPGEPLDETNPNARLDEAPPVDLLGLGGTTSTAVVIPVAPEPEESGPDSSEESRADASGA